MGETLKSNCRNTQGIIETLGRGKHAETQWETVEDGQETGETYYSGKQRNSHAENETDIGFNNSSVYLTCTKIVDILYSNTFKIIN